LRFLAQFWCGICSDYLSAQIFVRFTTHFSWF
jgi:hypothetical protein